MAHCGDHFTMNLETGLTGALADTDQHLTELTTKLVRDAESTLDQGDSLMRILRDVCEYSPEDWCENVLAHEYSRKAAVSVFRAIVVKSMLERLLQQINDE